MKKIFRKIHLWLAVPAGIVITLMCLTGAILVFQEELLRLFHPGRYKVEVTAPAPLPLDHIVERVNAQLGGDTVTAIQVWNDPARTYRATLTSGPRSHAYIDPYTAEVTGFYNYRAGFFFQVTRLHRWLMMSDRDTGRIITGVSTIFLVIVIVSGFVIWWPKRRNVRKSFAIQLKQGPMRRLFDLHRVLGVYAVLFLLLFSLTGLMWSFPWYRTGVSKLFGVELAAGTGHSGGRTGQGSGRGERQSGSRRAEQDGGRGENRSRGEGETESVRPYSWQAKLDAIATQMPDYRFVRIADSPEVTLLSANAPHERATDTYRYQSGSGELTPVAIYGAKKDSSYLMTWAYSLHVGSWGGFLTKLLSFIAALIGASLPVTGYILIFRKRSRRRKTPSATA